MLSRRSFIFRSLGISIASYAALESLLPLSALAKRAAAKVVAPSRPAGPHIISKDEWPPAILPDRVGVTNGGLLCFTDEFGRLALVDLRNPQNPKTPAKTVSEIRGLGPRVLDFAVCNASAYGLTIKENEQQEQSPYLISLTLTQVNDQKIANEMRLNRYTEANKLACSNDFVVVGGTSHTGENLVSIFGASHNARASEPSFVAALSLKMPIRGFDIFEHQLLILSSSVDGRKSQLDFVTLQGNAPEIQKSLTFDGDFRVISRIRDQILIAGQDQPGAKAKAQPAIARLIVAGKDKDPHATSSLTLDPIIEVESAAANKERFVVMGRSRTDRIFLSLTSDKAHALSQGQVLKMPKGKHDGGKKSQIVLRDNVAYVASGWSGVQMLTKNKGQSGFEVTYSYTIPRLAASGLAIWQDMAVLAAAELQLYNLNKPEHPQLVSTAETDNAIKSMVGAGSFVLCLTRDQVVLRQMKNLSEVVATTKLSASQLCFDRISKRSFAIRAQDKSTKIHSLKVFSNSIESEKPQEIPGLFNHVQALGNVMALSGLNDIVTYDVSDQSKYTKVGSRHFENLAVRDIGLTEKNMIVTAIDTNSKGFFLVLDRQDPDLRVLGSIDLPHDALALACSADRAAVIGKGADGKDVVSVVDFSSAGTPKILANLDGIEGSSSVTIREKDQMAIVAGRGLALVALS